MNENHGERAGYYAHAQPRASVKVGKSDIPLGGSTGPNNINPLLLFLKVPGTIVA